MSIRVKNGITYYRYSRTIDGVRYYYEEKNPPLEILEKHRHELTSDIVRLIFEKYGESHPQHIPLLLIELGLPVKEAYEIRLDQIDFETRQIRTASGIYPISYSFASELKDKAYNNMKLMILKKISFENYIPINIYDNGKEINWKTSHDVSRWIRKNIDPYFTFHKLALYYLSIIHPFSQEKQVVNETY